ncbi:LLM class flavin-dependent oxidoreductase [Phytoactinopolyspora alkaliphila]|uniref:LLM class flavin-dependent oxidoreductase n=1 Tax=Phytoactinopolyspora alkaliphila TaxID=1783498 RepID=A0A6N9YRM9_9ACTN|nr:LLM class flavin-dependent oxidoreductase [Phytoactinopolyspora alkaliphila]NED97459.1 LLM class flavin-dependent oxidoreductase [Phytoactinopolyspora alkaliphila]
MPNVGTPSSLIDLAVVADDAGWDGFFVWDHVNALPQMHDPWVVLGAMAARTTRVRLGTLVTPVPRRRPWKLAKEVVTLDHVSEGRAILGVGLGVPVDAEYGAFGESTSVPEHAARLDEALPLLDAFLRGDRVDHDGEHYQVHAQLDPPALQTPRPPIWAAATVGRDRPLARALRVDGIYPLSGLAAPTPAELSALVERLNPPAGFDVVGVLTDSASADDLAAAGATWALDGPRHPEEPREELLARIAAGPPR